MSESAAQPPRLTPECNGSGNLGPGDEVVLMPAAAHLDAVAGEWVVPLHVWVHVLPSSRLRRAAIAKLLELRYGLHVTETAQLYFAPRINLLLADNKRGRTVVVEVAGKKLALPPTSANGHARADLRLPATPPWLPGTRLTARVLLPPGDDRAVASSVELIGPTGLSVISDIDDTVKVTNVVDKGRMWEATFYKPFAAVSGMAEAYRRLAAGGASFHFVSSSPWHLAPPLIEFLHVAGFPQATIALKHMRLKDRTLLDIVRPGRETKPPQIEAIFARFPGRRFILIGDSGEDDPEIYADASRRHATQIERILIRNVTGARRDDARFSRVFAGIDPQRWMLFTDAEEIKLNP